MFEEIDPTLARWCQSRKLLLQREYRGEPARSTELVDDQGCRYQLWVEKNGSDLWTAHAWDFGDRRGVWSAPSGDLASALDLALDQVMEWIGRDGHGWHPV